MDKIKRKRAAIAALLLCIVLASSGYTECGKSGDSNKPKDVRRDVAVQIHRIENTLLRLTELKEELSRKQLISDETRVKIARTLLQVNDITLAANKFLKKTKELNPTNRREILDLIISGLNLVNELNQDSSLISGETRQYLDYVNILRTALLAAQTIIEGVR